VKSYLPGIFLRDRSFLSSVCFTASIYFTAVKGKYLTRMMRLSFLCLPAESTDVVPFKGLQLLIQDLC